MTTKTETDPFQHTKKTKKAAPAIRAAKATASDGAAPETVKCPKCQCDIPLTEDRKEFEQHFADCGEVVKVVIMASFTVRMEPDPEAQLPRLHPDQLRSHTLSAINGLKKSLKARNGMLEVFVRRT